MKKILSVLITISIILSGMAVNVSAVEEVLVKESFDNVSCNTEEVLSQSRGVDENSEKLSHMFDKTIVEINEISSGIESTTALLQEISANITLLNKNISNIVEEQNEISALTEKLVN